LLDLYHNQGVDPRAMAIAFKNLAENHPEAAQSESRSVSESYTSKYDQRNANNQFVDTAESGANVTFNQNNYTSEQKKTLAT